MTSILPATVGANRGSEGQFFQMGRFDQSGSVYRGPSGSNGVDYLDNKSFCFNAGSANGFPGNGVITVDTCGLFAYLLLS